MTTTMATKKKVHFEVRIGGGWFRCAKAVRTGKADWLHYQLKDGTVGLTRDWKAVTTVTK